MYNKFVKLYYSLYSPFGGVKASTGTLKCDKRAELRCNLLKLHHVLNINARNNITVTRNSELVAA